eukprot:6048900-Prymnesium_polylepis.1
MMWYRYRSRIIKYKLHHRATSRVPNPKRRRKLRRRTPDQPRRPGAATDPPDRARMMLTGWGVTSLFTPMKSLFQAVP